MRRYGMPQITHIDANRTQPRLLTLPPGGQRRPWSHASGNAFRCTRAKNEGRSRGPRVTCFGETPGGVEPPCRALQARASPLGHGVDGPGGSCTHDVSAPIAGATTPTAVALADSP